MLKRRLSGETLPIEEERKIERKIERDKERKIERKRESDKYLFHFFPKKDLRTSTNLFLPHLSWFGFLKHKLTSRSSLSSRLFFFFWIKFELLVVISFDDYINNIWGVSNCPLSEIRCPLSVVRGPLSTIFKAFIWMSRIFSASVVSFLSFLRDSSGDVELGFFFFIFSIWISYEESQTEVFFLI